MPLHLGYNTIHRRGFAKRPDTEKEREEKDLNTLEVAKLTLRDGGCTCVIASEGKVVFTSKERGVKPLLDYYREHGDAHKGAALADKVIGRAAALLAQLLGVGELYAGVMSEGALEELNKAGIHASYETKVEAIRNRDNTGFCPMEQLSKGVDDPREMLARVEEFLAAGKGPRA